MDLQVTELCCARGGLDVLAGVSFVLPAGQALVLRGPNGTGKTTLLRTLAGLQPATGGRVSQPPEAMAYAGHSDGAKATLTLAENLSFWAQVHGASERDGVAQALGRFGLDRLASRPAGQVSAGQRRRLSLARLTMSNRRIWLLDEPTVSLDTVGMRLFAGAVATHLAAGGSALIASHGDVGFVSSEHDLRGAAAAARSGTRQDSKALPGASLPGTSLPGTGPSGEGPSGPIHSGIVQDRTGHSRTGQSGTGRSETRSRGSDPAWDGTDW